MRGIRTTAVASVCLLVMIGISAPAQADDVLDLTSVESITSIAPENTIIETDNTANLAISQQDDGHYSVAAENEDGSASLDFSVNNGSELLGEQDDSTILHDPDDESSTVVRVNGYGGQVVFAADKSEGLKDFSITFSKDIETLTELGEGVKGLYFADGSSIALQEAWAVDGSGQSLSTGYEFDGRELTQTINTNSMTQYPVVADPAWSYALSYPVHNTTPTMAKNTLKKAGNFGPIFGVSGAPKNYPKVGQVLPLKIVVWNFPVKYNREYTGSLNNAHWWGFELEAVKGHVDGPGSKIKFQVNSNPRATSKYFNNQMWVYANIKNSNPLGLPRAVYKEGASRAWSDFASRLNTKSGGRIK